MNNAHFAIWAKEPMFAFDARVGTDSLFSYSKHFVPVIGMHHVPYSRYVKRTRMRHQSKDAKCFIGPDHVIRFEIPNPVADVSNALRFFEPLSAFLQISRQSMTRFLRMLQFRDVLNRSEQPVGLSRRCIFRVARQGAPKLRRDRVHRTHFATRTDDTMLMDRVYSGSKFRFHSAV